MNSEVDSQPFPVIEMWHEQIDRGGGAEIALSGLHRAEETLYPTLPPRQRRSFDESLPDPEAPKSPHAAFPDKTLRVPDPFETSYELPRHLSIPDITDEFTPYDELPHTPIPDAYPAHKEPFSHERRDPDKPVFSKFQ